MLDGKSTLLEVAEGLKKGMFVGIRSYANAHGEVMDVVVHADADYANTHNRSLTILNDLAKDETLKFTITRNAWIDEKGVEHNRKAKGRTLKTGIVETITIHDKDFAEAVAKVQKSISEPRKVENFYDKDAPSAYTHEGTGKLYLRNVLLHSKVVIRKGSYPLSCSARVNAIVDAITEMLPVGQYRNYILDDELVTLEDGTNVPRFKEINLMGDTVSSSSSSD